MRAWRAIAGQGVNFKTHVIDFNLKQGQERGLRCLAQNTGSVYVSARDPQSLQKPLTVTVKQAAAPSPPKPKKVAAFSGVKARAFIGKGGRQWDGEISLTILVPSKALKERERRSLASGVRRQPSL